MTRPEVVDPMKKVSKLIGVLIALFALVALAGYGYVETTYDRVYPDTPLPNIKASTDPEVIKQGEYVANAVAHCSACHGPAEAAAERKLGPRHDLRGGFVMKAGPFGQFVPANITPDPETGIGKLSDGQIARVIRHGIDRRDRFSAFMSLAVGDMSDEDLTAVVSYLRSVPPVKSQTAATQWGIIAKALSGSFGPKRGGGIPHVASGTVSVGRGEYLAKGPALCGGCHSGLDVMDGFKPVGVPFAGANEADPDPFDKTAEFVAPNLTPDPKTGIMANWSEEQFLARFRAGRTFQGSKMPWENFAQMTDEDLRSIYRFLRTLPPTPNDLGPTRRAKGWKPAN
jgi:mono/diheme cytochrome c family protein